MFYHVYYGISQMDNVISQAQATLGTLVLQRTTFGGISTKTSNVSSRLPTVCGLDIRLDPELACLLRTKSLNLYDFVAPPAQVNHILSAIRRKKSMDTIVLSLVASVCTFFILIYWLSK